MATIVLTVHLVLAALLIVVVLLQRSEGGALGMGGGGGGGLVSQRGAATALSKVTWLLAVAFICTSMALTMLADGRQGSVFDGQTPVVPGGEAVDPLLGPAPGTTGEGGLPLPSAPAQ